MKPRTIDIDIVFYDDLEVNKHNLKIQHYDWQNRLFVVEPLYEVLNKPLDKSSFKIFSSVLGISFKIYAYDYNRGTL